MRAAGERAELAIGRLLRRRRSWLIVIGLGSALALWGPIERAHASPCGLATITWDGGAGTNSWHQALNWSPNQVPTTGDYVCIGTASVTFSTGATTVAGVESGGALTISGGTLTITDTSVESPLKDLTQSGGTLTGAASVSISGIGTWTGGLMNGVGSTRVLPTGRLDIPGPGAVGIQSGRTLDNEGLVVWSGAVAINASTGIVIDNSGTFEIAANATLADVSSSSTPDPRFQNTGLLHKTGGGGTTTVGTDIENDGELRVDSGSVTLTGGDGGNSSDGSFVGPVTFSMGSYALDGATLTQATTSAMLDVIGNSPTVVPLDGSLAMSGGNISGSGVLEVAGVMTHTGGNTVGSGTTRVTSTGRLDIASTNGFVVQTGRTFDNAGTVRWLSTGPLNAYAEAVIVNTGLFEGNVRIHDDSGTGADPQLHNTGTIRKNTGTTITPIAVDFDNDGIVEVTSGGLDCSGGDGGLTHTGSFTGSVGFSNLSHTFDGAILNGANIAVSAYFEGDDPTVVPAGGTLTLSAGAIRGEGVLEVSGTMTLSGGSMRDDGMTAITSTGQLNVMADVTVTGREIDNAGTITFSAADSLIGDAAVLRNDGLMDGEVDIADAANGGVQFLLLNTGTIRKDAGTGTTRITADVDNDGTLLVTSGGLQLLGGTGQLQSSGTFDGVTFLTGTYTLVAATITDVTLSAARLDVIGTNPTTLSAGSSLTMGNAASILGGTGTLRVGGSLLWRVGSMVDAGTTSVLPGGTLDASMTGGGLTLGTGRTIDNDGTFSFSGPSTLTAQAGSVVHNSGLFELIGARTVADGSAGSVRGIVVNTGTLRKTNTVDTATLQLDLDNQGTLAVDGGTLSMPSGARLLNYSSSRKQLTKGSYTLKGVFRFPNTGVIVNAASVALDGTAAAMRDTAGSDALASLARNTPAGSIDVRNGAALTTPADFVNTGAVVIGPNSTFTATGPFEQTTGSTTMEASTSTLTASSTGVELEGGTLSAVGTVDADVVVSGGELRPGGGLKGTVTVTGDYAQSGVGVLRSDITAGGADLVDVDGAATIGGHLVLATASGYTPDEEDSFTLVSGTSLTGLFSPIDGADLGNGTVYWMEPDATSLPVVVRPSSIASWGSVTINGGAADTTTRSVTLTLAVPAGQSVSGVRISNDVDPTGTFVAYSSTIAWTLADADGTRAVHVQFRDDVGNQSAIVLDTIVLDTRTPTATVTPPTASTGPIIVTFDELVTGASLDNVVLRPEGSSANLPAALTCEDASGAPVACATGLLRRALLQPTAPLAPRVRYTTVVNPVGTAPAIVDAAGNPVATTSVTFALDPLGGI